MSRLAWFPFYVDDFLGGTSTMLVSEIGSYLAAMLAQWQSGDLQAIPDDPARLARICGGEPFPASVRTKFESIIINDKAYLRNTRLAKTWEKQKAAHKAQGGGGKRGGKPPSKQGGNPQGNPDKNPEPITHNPDTQKVEPTVAPLLAAYADACCFDLRSVDELRARRLSLSLDKLREMEPDLSDELLASDVRDCGRWHFEIHWPGRYMEPDWIPGKWKQFREWQKHGVPQRKNETSRGNTSRDGAADRGGVKKPVPAVS